MTRNTPRRPSADRNAQGKRLTEFRQYLGLTQAEAALKFAACKKTWVRYEIEGRKPKRAIMTLLTSAGLNSEWLFTGKGVMLLSRSDQFESQPHSRLSWVSRFRIWLARRLAPELFQRRPQPDGDPWLLDAMPRRYRWRPTDSAPSISKKQTLACDIGMRLRIARLKLDLTQIQLSEITGVSAQTIKKYEAGKCVPGGLAIIKFCKAGINAHWLITGVHPERPA